MLHGTLVNMFTLLLSPGMHGCDMKNMPNKIIHDLPLRKGEKGIILIGHCRPTQQTLFF